jgi:hypothetical protein
MEKILEGALLSLQHSPSMQVFFQSNLVDHVECLLKLFELCSIETFLEDANNLIICLDGHHFNEGHLASTYGTWCNTSLGSLSSCISDLREHVIYEYVVYQATQQLSWSHVWLYNIATNGTFTHAFIYHSIIALQASPIPMKKKIWFTLVLCSSDYNIYLVLFSAFTCHLLISQKPWFDTYWCLVIPWIKTFWLQLSLLAVPVPSSEMTSIEWIIHCTDLSSPNSHDEPAGTWQEQ